MRRLLRRMIPGTHELRRHTVLRRIFGRTLFDPDRWHLGRSSVAWAVSLGLFMAWAPVPFQMILAAGAALVARCNLPVAVAAVWVSNPVTVAPMFYAAHKLGAWILDRPPGDFRIEVSLRWLFEGLGQVWEPLLLGCFVLGLASALLGQVLIRLAWRAHTMASWRERRIRRRRRRDPIGSGSPAPGIPPPAPVGSPGKGDPRL